MKKTKLIFITSMLISSLCLSSCEMEKYDDNTAKSDISEVTSETDSTGITESEPVNISETSPVTTSESFADIGQQDMRIISDLSTEGETYYTLNNFVFPVSNEYKLYDTGIGCMEFKSVNTGNVIYFGYDPDTNSTSTYSDSLDILKEYSEMNNAEFNEEKSYNGLCGSYYYCGDKADNNLQLCMFVTNSNTADYSDDTRYLQVSVCDFDDFDDITNTLNNTMGKIIYDENEKSSDVQFRTFDCPYFSITENDKWVYGYGDYKMDHDEYYVTFHHSSDGENPSNYTAFSADDNVERNSLEAEAADYLKQDFETKRSEKINYMGYDAIEIILVKEDCRFKYIIFDTGNALITIFSNIGMDNYDSICDDSNEFIKNLIVK